MGKPLLSPEHFPPAAPPDCTDCGDTGWIEFHQDGDPEGQLRLRPCPCVKVRLYEKRIDELDRENARFKGLTLSTYEPENEAQAQALAACTAWAKAWPEVERGVLLMGPVGVGKTGLLWAAAKAAGIKEFEVPVILRALDLADAPVFIGRDEHGMPTRNEIITRSVKRRLLIFDDLGTGKRSESADGTYFRLLDKRHLACMPTLVTTNYIEEAVPIMGGGIIEPFQSRIGGRLHSRLQQLCDFYEISGTDRRRQGEQT